MKTVDILILTIYSPAILFALFGGLLIWSVAWIVSLPLRFLESRMSR